LKKDIKKQIDWYFDFAQTKLEALSKGDVAKLINDAEELIYRGMSGRLWTPADKLELLSTPHGSYPDFEWLLQLQRSFQEIFEPIMNRIKRLSEYPESGWKTYSDSKLVDGILLSEPLQVSFKAEILVFGPLEYDHSGTEVKVRAGRDWAKQSTITVETRPTINDQSLFIYGFVRHLSGIPTEAFKQCNDCQKWFLHLTKRKREFCNNLCAARSANRIRRAKEKKEDPVKYEMELEKSRKRAGKSYDKKIRKLHKNARINSPRKK
jgi:hypothetical protein